MSFVRLAETGRAPVAISVDGRPVQALAGDTLLTALRAAGLALRRNEFDGAACGGFCLMVEALGLAAMSETPLVIAEVQREISWRVMPLSTMAIASADICSSATTPRV